MSTLELVEPASCLLQQLLKQPESMEIQYVPPSYPIDPDRATQAFKATYFQLNKVNLQQAVPVLTARQ